MNNHYILILSIVGIAAGLFLLAGNYFYNFSILSQKKEFLNTDPDLRETKSGAAWDSNKEWLLQQAQQELVIESQDGLQLHAIYIANSNPSTKTVVLIHGYNSWHGSMGGFAQFYLEELGYNVLLPDLRGHGKSEGNYIGFGWHDRKDLLLWIDVAVSKTGMNTQIVLHGVSMGGAAVLMTSGEILPDNVACIVSDCAFTSAKDILAYQMKRMFQLPSFPIMHFTSFLCKLQAGFFIREASAIKQVQKSKVPILFIHGSADRFVPAKMVHELYEAAACPKQLLVVNDAAHGTSFWKDTLGYKTAVKTFLDLCPDLSS
jgi:pimeloyl-ACP methyl ester carboxylesterase